MHDGIRDVTGHLSRAGIRRQRRKLFIRILLAILSAGILALAGALALNAYIKHSSAPRILSEETAARWDADCILVLGAGVREDGSPSHMLEDRLLTGIALYEAGASERLLMSGDHGQIGYNEVGVMKSFAVDAGVPSEAVFMDHAGFSTYESLCRARDVFGAKKILIVTQSYHLYRALYTAERLGLEACGVSADVRTYWGQPMREVREIAARVKDALWCVIQPPPTYLGEAIPLSGDGNCTNDDGYESVRAGKILPG